MIKRIHVMRPKFFLPNLVASGARDIAANGNSTLADARSIRHGVHFCLTLATFGLWGLVWWYLILREQGQGANFLAGFDDDYWSYLIEREQPPAALYPQQFSSEPQGFFEA